MTTTPTEGPKAMARASRTCFVIMPYGYDADATRKHFTGIFTTIIAPAADRAGFIAKRSDISAEPGNITHDIIRDLADSEVVIADLTNANANVFFELGIRHAFRKSGTIHIVDATHQIPFDVRQYRAIPYTTELAEIPRIVEEIAVAIRKRVDQRDRADNPVHDAMPELPLDVRSIGDAALREQLKKSEESFRQVQAERDQVWRRLADLDPSGALNDTQPDIQVDALFDEADAVMRGTGRNVLLRLRGAAVERGAEAFAKELRVILKGSELSENDFAEIVIICQELGLGAHRRAVLEIATNRYPSNTELFLALATAYDDSPKSTIRERGRIMLEKHLDVVHDADGPRLASRPGRAARAALGTLLNSYKTGGKYEWILSMTRSAEELLGADALWFRARADAFHRSGQDEQAKDAYERGLEIDPSDDTTMSLFADFLDDQGKYEEAYEMFENAVAADPEDASRFVNLAINILNRGIVRVDPQRLEGPMPRKQRIPFVMPLMMRALDLGDQSIREQVVRVLVRADAMSEAKAISAGAVPDGEMVTFPLEYVDTLAQNEK